MTAEAWVTLVAAALVIICNAGIVAYFYGQLTKTVENHETRITEIEKLHPRGDRVAAATAGPR